MSRSTQVEIVTEDTVVKFTTYSRRPAELLKVPLNERRVFVGKQAHEALETMSPIIGMMNRILVNAIASIAVDNFNSAWEAVLEREEGSDKSATFTEESSISVYVKHID